MKTLSVNQFRRKLGRPSEKDVQQRVVRVFEAYSGVVKNLSQPRATMQSAGFGDLYVFLPRQKCTVWWETKRPGGKQSPDQVSFETWCRSCNQDYGCGGVDEVVAYLRSIGEKVPL